MTGARVLLLIHGLMNTVFAVMIAADTPVLAEFLGLQILTPDGRIELLAMYVGGGGAMGLFLLYAAVSGRRVLDALLLTGVFMGGLALFRTLGVLWFEPGANSLGALVYDVPVAVLALWLLWKYRCADGHIN